ncbi:MAG: hypothetical protein OXC02_00715 [Rhodobacteraceae bacterium]|nr:hypothetical protein [Paracoccaceae bacterium]
MTRSGKTCRYLRQGQLLDRLTMQLVLNQLSCVVNRLWQFLFWLL